MKVKELIEKLAEFNDDAEVMIECEDDYYIKKLEYVGTYYALGKNKKDDTKVWLS